MPDKRVGKAGHGRIRSRIARLRVTRNRHRFNQAEERIVEAGIAGAIERIFPARDRIRDKTV